jgi:spermidine synthase
LTTIAQKHPTAGAHASAGRFIAAHGRFALGATLLFGSGAASLIFQLLWIKQLSLVVGVEVRAIAAVVSAYFLGLALGSAFWGRIADRVTRPFRLYGLIEIGVALAGVAATFLLAGAAPVFARVEASSGVLAWALPFAAVGLPAALMGGTLPVLAKALSSEGRSISAAAARLYSANTAGAVVGALLPALALIPSLGVAGSSWAAGSMSALIGVVALLLDYAGAPTLLSTAIDRRSEKVSRDSLIALALSA